jgi:uncharacterized protein (TIGR02246 family)
MDDVEAIKQLKARYFRAIDTKDWPALRQVFTGDVVVDATGSGGGVVRGADEFVEYLQQILGDAITVHHGHMPEIDITSPTGATGIWAMEDVIVWSNGSRMHGFGHYHEVYRRIDDSWLIASSTLTRLHMDLTGPLPDQVQPEPPAN